MGKLAAIRPNAVDIIARTGVELDFSGVAVTPPGERLSRRIEAGRCDLQVVDAQRCKRFVRHLRVVHRGARLDIISPPEDGAIAPRCARVPVAPARALVIDDDAFEVMVEWLTSRCALRSRTMPDLAGLASWATSGLAVHIGERAARLAVEMTSVVCGPLRGCGSPRQVMAPLVVAARRSERASEALVAALAVGFHRP